MNSAVDLGTGVAVATVPVAVGEARASGTGDCPTIDSGVAEDSGAALGVAGVANWSAPLQPRTSPAPNMNATRPTGAKRFFKSIVVVMIEDTEYLYAVPQDH